MAQSLNDKIRVIRARLIAPTLEDPRLDFKPGAKYHKTLPGSASKLSKEKFFPWTETTPTGRPARIPVHLLNRPLQIAFGRYHWIDRITYRSQPSKPPIERDTPILLADAIADRERNGFVVTSIPQLNPLIEKWIEKNGGTVSHNLHTGLVTDFIDYEIIDDINVGCFLGKAALPARAFEITNTPPGVGALLGEHPRTVVHRGKGIPLDPELDLDQRDVVGDIINGRSIVVRGGPGCGKTRAVSDAIRIMVTGGSSVAFASPVPGAIRSIRRLLPDLPFTTVDMSKGELLQEKVDTLIVDEASAITPLQTMPLVAKATQIVIVGDPNQCPPPKSLPRIDGEESLLTWAMKLRHFMKPILRYHYRTPHPAVIDPVNVTFYVPRMRIVPVPWSNPLDGVYHHRLEGERYDGVVHAGEVDRTEAIIDRITRIDPSRSIMVITLNTRQRAAIADRLATRHPEVRVVYARDAQGDEADDIILTAAPGTKVGANNHPDTFETRLFTVALSRARRSMHIVIGPKCDRHLPAPIHFLNALTMLAITNRSYYPDTMQIAAHAMDRFGDEKVVVFDYGCVIAIRRETSPDWEVGVMPPIQTFLSKEENRAMKHMLLAKGWNIVDPWEDRR